MRVTKSYYEHIRITGRHDELDKAFTYCDKHGFEITRSGPYPHNAVSVDTSRFLIRARRPIDKKDVL